MSSRLEPPASKGMSMIAAYRAERLRQRPILRNSLRCSHEARRFERESGVRPEADEPVPEPASPSDEINKVTTQPIETRSVFASYSDMTVDETAQAQDAPDLEALTVVCHGVVDELGTDPVEPSLVADPLADRGSVRPVSDQPDPMVFDPPLAEIGFGPGMLIRLSQIGVRTTRELASADLGELRSALGDISRLVDVGAWIGSAQRILEVGSRP